MSHGRRVILRRPAVFPAVLSFQWWTIGVTLNGRVRWRRTCRYRRLNDGWPTPGLMGRPVPVQNVLPRVRPLILPLLLISCWFLRPVPTRFLGRILILELRQVLLPELVIFPVRGPGNGFPARTLFQITRGRSIQLSPVPLFPFQM